MRSIRSLGGPLILLPSELVSLWTGSYGPEGEEDWEEEETEYWRISEEFTDFAGVIDVHGKSALVLANGASPTIFLQSQRLFVQVLAKSSDIDVVSAVDRVLPTVEWQYSTNWMCDGPGLLFDSAMYGPDVKGSDGMLIDLPAGQYMVRCSYREPDSAADIFLALTTLTHSLD